MYAPNNTLFKINHDVFGDIDKWTEKSGQTRDIQKTNKRDHNINFKIGRFQVHKQQKSPICK